MVSTDKIWFSSYHIRTQLNPEDYYLSQIILFETIVQL